MRSVGLLVVLGACFVEEPPPPFHLELVNFEDGRPLADLHFDSYEQGRELGPYNVRVTQDGDSELISVEVGWCDVGCFGDIEHERLELLLVQPHAGNELAGNVGAFECWGTQGSQRGNVVIQGHASCWRE